MFILFVLYVYSILLDYDFNKLEDIWFTSASHLTMATMELLMDRLPELLSIGMDAFILLTTTMIISICISILLGQLTGWNISNDEIFLLKTILKSGNSCLTLSPANIYS